jgi:hypothetical protein
MQVEIRRFPAIVSGKFRELPSLPNVGVGE